MVTAPVYRNAYTTYYTSCEKTDCLQATVTIVGQKGKQIRIDSLSLSLASTLSSATAEAWIVAVIDGEKTELVKWKESSTMYQTKSTNPAYLVPEGKNVTLNWHIKTSSGTSKAMMKYIKYERSFVDVQVISDPVVEPPVVDPPVVTEPVEKSARILIICKPGENVNAVVESLKTCIGDRIIEQYKQV
ncbi:MAG: hypothetical protein PHH48_06370 [Eubacteriales bacterium]|nr:hypothetical protein [Eubacteriales bacterium]